MLSRRGKAPMLLLIILLVAIVGVMGVFVFMKKASSSPGKPTVEVAKQELVPLEEFVVNLADKNQSRYLKVEISLEMRGAECKAEVDEQKPKVRDTIIQVLSSRYYNDLLDPEGKEALKEDIRKSLEKVLEKSKVTGAFFTSFAMQ